MDEDVADFFLLVLVIGGEAKVAIAVHKKTTPQCGYSVILRGVNRPAHY